MGNSTARRQQVGKTRVHHRGAFVSCSINRSSITKLRTDSNRGSLALLFCTLEYQVTRQLTASCCPLTAVVAKLCGVSSSLVFTHNTYTHTYMHEEISLPATVAWKATSSRNTCISKRFTTASHLYFVAKTGFLCSQQFIILSFIDALRKHKMHNFILQYSPHSCCISDSPQGYCKYFTSTLYLYTRTVFSSVLRFSFFA